MKFYTSLTVMYLFAETRLKFVVALNYFFLGATRGLDADRAAGLALALGLALGLDAERAAGLALGLDAERATGLADRAPARAAGRAGDFVEGLRAGALRAGDFVTAMLKFLKFYYLYNECNKLTRI